MAQTKSIYFISSLFELLLFNAYDVKVLYSTSHDKCGVPFRNQTLHPPGTSKASIFAKTAAETNLDLLILGQAMATLLHKPSTGAEASHITQGRSIR
jgi:hypothetical protein